VILITLCRIRLYPTIYHPWCPSSRSRKRKQLHQSNYILIYRYTDSNEQQYQTFWYTDFTISQGVIENS